MISDVLVISGVMPDVLVISVMISVILPEKAKPATAANRDGSRDVRNRRLTWHKNNQMRVRRRVREDGRLQLPRHNGIRETDENLKNRIKHL